MRRGRPWTIAGVLALGIFLFPSAAIAKPAPKPLTFTVEMTYIQTRDWNYYYQQVGYECSGTDQGSGSDVANITATATFGLQKGRRGFASLGAEGTHSRVGTMSHTVGTPSYPGADCGGPENTTNDPVDGCGSQPVRPNFASLDLVGKKLVLAWDAPLIPEFDCPYYDHSNGASSNNTLPGDSYRDVIATGVDRKHLLKATKQEPAFASGRSEVTKTETCANLVEPCGNGDGITYNATATVKTAAKFLFTPIKKH
jgi:hypothetical protein